MNTNTPGGERGGGKLYTNKQGTVGEVTQQIPVRRQLHTSTKSLFTN